MKEYARRAALAAGCGLTVLSFGCTRQQPPPDTLAAQETAIRQADLAWSKAMTDKQLDGTVSYYAEEASIFPPNAPTATGKNAIRDVWAQFFAMPGFLVTCHPVKIEASRSGDIGYTQGPYDLAFNDAKGNTVKDRGKYPYGRNRAMGHGESWRIFSTRTSPKRHPLNRATARLPLWFGLRGMADGSAEQPRRHRAGLGSKVDEHNALIAVADRSVAQLVEDRSPKTAGRCGPAVFVLTQGRLGPPNTSRSIADRQTLRQTGSASVGQLSGHDA